MANLERFDDYMDRCLYGADGFYSSGRGIAGRRGDFITSPEVGPLFGAIVAAWLDEVWDDLGQPADFAVVDAGTGPGTLLRSLVLAAPRCSSAWTLHGVDVAVDEERTGDGFTIGPTMPTDLGGAVVIANELLDNMAFRWVERGDDGLVEVMVANDARVDVALSDPLPDAIAAIPVGTSAPWLSKATAWIDGLQAAGVARTLVFDYGSRTTVDLATRGGWLRTYQGHGRGDDPFVAPGRLDITTDIAVDQLPAPSSVSTQAEFLERHGIAAMVEEGREYWSAHAAKPDLAAFRMRSRIGESNALLDPAGLGTWLAIQW